MSNSSHNMNGVNISKVLAMEQGLNLLFRDVNKLMTASSEHSADIKQVISDVKNTASKAELVTAIKTYMDRANSHIVADAINAPVVITTAASTCNQTNHDHQREILHSLLNRFEVLEKDLLDSRVTVTQLTNKCSLLEDKCNVLEDKVKATNSELASLQPNESHILIERIHQTTSTASLDEYYRKKDTNRRDGIGMISVLVLLSSVSLLGYAFDQHNRKAYHDKVMKQAAAFSSVHRLDLISNRIDTINSNMKLLDNEHSAFLSSHMQLMKRFNNTETVLFGMADKLMIVCDNLQSNCERLELYSIDQSRDMKTLTDKIKVLSNKVYHANAHSSLYGGGGGAAAAAQPGKVSAMGLGQLLEISEENYNDNDNVDRSEMKKYDKQMKDMHDKQLSLVTSINEINKSIEDMKQLIAFSLNGSVGGNSSGGDSVYSNIKSIAAHRLELYSNPTIIDMRRDIEVIQKKLSNLYSMINSTSKAVVKQKHFAPPSKLYQHHDDANIVATKGNSNGNTDSSTRVKLSGPKEDSHSNSSHCDNSNVDVRRADMVEAPTPPVSVKVRNLFRKHVNLSQKREPASSQHPFASILEPEIVYTDMYNKMQYVESMQRKAISNQVDDPNSSSTTQPSANNNMSEITYSILSDMDYV